MGLLDDRVVIVTGSTRGIGRAMAERFSAEGGRVVVHGRQEDGARAVAAELPGAIGLGAEMSDPAAVRTLVERAVERLGGVDALVNNAGVSSRQAVTRITDDEWRRVLETNLSGPLYAIRAVVPAMKAAGRGSIVNVISGAATHGIVGFSAYAASKGGLVGLTVTLARELAAFGIRVNALSPAALTDMLRELPPSLLDPMVDRGMPSPDAVADAALFLVSDLSRATTGQVLDATLMSQGA